MKKLLFTLLLILLVACSKQAPIETIETKIDISEELNQITEDIEDLDFNEDIDNISQEFEKPEKIEVPAALTENINQEIAQNKLEKEFDIITKTGNTIKLILPNEDPNGIKIDYIFQFPFDKEGTFKDAKKGEYKTKITAIAQNAKIEKEFSILIN